MKVKKDALLNSLPPEWPVDLLPLIRAKVKESGIKVVALDDDPTGNQTVHSVPVLTEWKRTALEAVLAEPGTLVYVLTNSRSMPLSQAQAMNREIVANLKAASRTTGRDFALVSRSDSTLRGHYPGEVTALIEELGGTVDGTLIIPFFSEGGRLTAHDMHYVTEGDWLVPAAETEYARDATFGYLNSNLRDWVSEKHGGRIRPEDVATVSLADVRSGGPEAVADVLDGVTAGRICVVNAVTYRDMEVFVAGLLRAEAAGRRFVYRTAASFLRVRGGISPRDLLTAADLSAWTERTALRKARKGGLIIVGSHVKKSTIQATAAQALPKVTGVEIAVEKLLDTNNRDHEIRRVVDLVDESVGAGQDALVLTTRQLVTGSDQEAALGIGQLVSTALAEVVSQLTEEPAWMIAKGGITASDIATQGLQVRRAEVLGQAIPGVPIWRTGQESRWKGLVYVVFPGNVGGPNALAEMIQILRGQGPARNAVSRP